MPRPATKDVIRVSYAAPVLVDRQTQPQRGNPRPAAGVDEPQPTLVRLTASAGAALRLVLAEAADGRETGGMLIGRADGVVVVHDVTGPLATDRRDHTSMMLNIDRGLELTAAYQRLGLGDLRLVGDWHTHPITTAPSETDLGSWRSWVEIQGRPWISLIACADSRLRCWLTADGPTGQTATTRRLPLEVEPIDDYILAPTVGGDRGLLGWRL